MCAHGVGAASGVATAAATAIACESLTTTLSTALRAAPLNCAAPSCGLRVVQQHAQISTPTRAQLPLLKPPRQRPMRAFSAAPPHTYMGPTNLTIPRPAKR